MSIFAEEKGLKELLGLVSLEAWSGKLQMEQGVDLPGGLPGACSTPSPICSLQAVLYVPWCWGTQRPDASPLHPDLSYMGNFKTLPVPFCSSRTYWFFLDPQILCVYFHRTVRDQKVLGAFLAEEEKNAVPYLQQILLLELSSFTSNKVLLHT